MIQQRMLGFRAVLVFFCFALRRAAEKKYKNAASPPPSDWLELTCDDLDWLIIEIH